MEDVVLLLLVGFFRPFCLSVAYWFNFELDLWII